ncbi:glutathione-S-transferase theta, GST [Zopfia rhizophila CBS 207.26]|uniref:Glutathione-S-transferase theta, GST n=1 Tax=Zopfia rhizophila CBS 207.26 TaxID=1314779 RepID=A0A6A6E354_9PEZI|nr:glutathione-S-transferase theta, GST [Zopfia rhizophila CBS 207.26]
MAASFTVYGYDDNPRTRIVKIVAAAEGITLNQSLVVPRKGINKAAYMELFPLSQGKIPALKGPGVRITETIAIAYELLPTLARWFLPLIPGFTDPAPYSYDAVEEGKRASLALLDKLEGVLEGVEWLVGDGPTLADIFVGAVLSRALQWVLDKKWREAHPVAMAHFERVRNWEVVAQVIPDFKLVEVEPPNVQPAKVI